MMGSALALIPLAQLAVLAAGIGGLRTTDLGGWGTMKAAAALAAMLALAAVIFLVSEPPYLFADFRKAYYPAAEAVLQGPASLAPVIESVRFVNLPSVAYLLAPLGLLPFRWAAIVFFIAGVAATLWAWRLLAREAQLKDRDALVLLLLFAASGPLLNSLREGNTSHFVLLGLVAALAMMRSGRQAQAGAVLGLCALIKLPLLIFAPYLLLRRNWHATAAFAGVIAAAAAVSFAVFGWDQNVRWFEICVLQFSRNPIGAFNVQSFPSFLLRLDGGDALLRNWTGQAVDPLQRYVATGLVLAMIAAAIAVGARRPHDQSKDEWRPLEFSLVTTLAVISSPMSWTHYYCWLLIPAAFFLNRQSVIASNATASGMAWAAIFLTAPAVLMPTFESTFLSLIYAKALVSHYLLGGLIWFGLLLWALTALSRQPALGRLARSPN